MKPVWTNDRFATFIITVAGLVNLVKAAENEFRKCYNTSKEMHCFDLQYDAPSNQWLTASFEASRQRCNDRNSTLLIIKDDETNDIVRRYLEDSNNPKKNNYVWIDAYRVNDYNNTYTWHWIDSKIPTIPASSVHDIQYYMYVAALQYRAGNFYLVAKQPSESHRYICEFAASNCSTNSSRISRLFNDRCYVASSDSVGWFEARNWCISQGGDLASFANVTTMNFTSWLLPELDYQYWIGLRFSWYIWIDTGEDVKFSKWISNGVDDRDSLCLIICFNCNPTFSWRLKNCGSADNTYVICDNVTTIQQTTTSISTPSISTTSMALTLRRSEDLQNNSSLTPYQSRGTAASNRIAIGVGVGVAVGIPVVITIILITICLVLRKRRQETTQSTGSTKPQQRRESMDHSTGDPTFKEMDEVGVSAYGTVVPSTFSSEPGEGHGANSATQPTEYAPLQFL